MIEIHALDGDCWTKVERGKDCAVVRAVFSEQCPGPGWTFRKAPTAEEIAELQAREDGRKS